MNRNGIDTGPATSAGAGGQLERKIVLLFLGAVVAVAVAVVHWPALSSRAILADDVQHVLTNPLVQVPSWDSVRRLFTEVWNPSTGGYYKPLAMTSLMLDRAIAGRPDDLRTFRRASLALHVANSLLVFTLLYLLLRQAWLAALVGLLYGVHPLTVESISWAAERKNLLAAFFSLWCLILYVKYTNRHAWGWYAAALFVYVLGLLSKPTSIPIVAALLLLDYWPLRRLSVRSLMEKIPFVVCAVAAGIVTVISQSRAGVATSPGEHGPVRILLVVCHNVVFYLGKIVWPARLSTFYPIPEPLSVSSPAVLIGVIGTAVLLVMVLVSWRWTRAGLVGALLFLALVSPTLGIVGFTDVIAADRFVYLPLVGLLLPLTHSARQVWDRSQRSSRRALMWGIVLVGAALLTTGEAVVTRGYLARWEDTETLSRHVVKLAPNSFKAHNALGIALDEKGKLEEAIVHYRKALELRPDFTNAHNNLGTALFAGGDVGGALQHFNEALRCDPANGLAHMNLANVLARLGRMYEAVEHYQQALRLEPGDFRVHYNLANALLRRGRAPEAIRHYREALRVRPDLTDARFSLAKALESVGRADDAIAEYRELLRLEPGYERARRRLDELTGRRERNP